MNEIDKLDGMVKTKKCGYEFIGGCKDLRTAKQKLEKIEEVIDTTCFDYAGIDMIYFKNELLKIIGGEN